VRLVSTPPQEQGETMTEFRNRVRELRRVRASELLPNPRNWRKHPDVQQAALRGVLEEVGFAGALLARERDDGRLELIDGHLRAETLADAEVPVLIVDLTADEAALLLAVHDPIGALAEADAAMLREITESIEVRSEAVSNLLEELLASDSATPLPDAAPPAELILGESYQVVVECADEAKQRALFERLTHEGRKCRALVL